MLSIYIFSENFVGLFLCVYVYLAGKIRIYLLPQEVRRAGQYFFSLDILYFLNVAKIILEKKNRAT